MIFLPTKNSIHFLRDDVVGVEALAAKSDEPIYVRFDDVDEWTGWT